MFISKVRTQEMKFQWKINKPKYLCLTSRFRKVCKQWRHASQSPLLWKRLDLSFMSKSSKANDKTLQNLASQYGEHILELNVSNWKKLTHKGLMVKIHNFFACRFFDETLLSLDWTSLTSYFL